MEVEQNGDLVRISNGDLTTSDENSFPIYLTRHHSRRWSPQHKSSSSRRKDRSPQRIVRRLIKKNGNSNIVRGKTPSLWDRYIRDMANTLVNSRWRWTVISLSSSFVLSWVIFGVIWMLISNANGDFDQDSPSPQPCLSGIQGFGGFVMFSMETQQTIGYGSRYINHYCPEATFLMCLQIILGCAICGAMVSIVNAKMVRPLQMHSRNRFSKHALIGIRDGSLCLIFRIRDENGRFSIGTTINVYLVQSKPKEPFLKSLALEPFGMLIWPLEIIHKITPSSPFWDLSAKELITKRFEIIASMTGTSAVTGQCSKTRTSFLSTEIQWGYRFKPCIHFDHVEETYYVDHASFNETQEVLTPLCSAQRLEEVIDEMMVTPMGSPRSEQYFNNENDQFPATSDNESVYDNLEDDFVQKSASDGEISEQNNERLSEIDMEVLIESLGSNGNCRETSL